MFHLSPREEEVFKEYAGDILDHEDYEKLNGFMAHGRITLYSHCLDVARLSLRMGRNKSVDEKALVRGALLHDFYLYDWHDARIDVPLFQMHGFTHPIAACERAKERLKINRIPYRPVKGFSQKAKSVSEMSEEKAKYRALAAAAAKEKVR